MVQARDIMNSSFIQLSVDDTVSKLMGVMLDKKQQYALLFSGKKYVGYAEKKYLMRSRIDPDKMKLKHILKHVPVLNPSDDVLTMSKAFITADVRVLPVIENKNIAGIIHAVDLLPSISYDLKGASISEVSRKKKLLVLSETDAIGYAINIMKKNKVDRAPVISKNNTLAGILTYVDLFSHFHIWPRCKGIHISRAASHQKGKKTGYGVGEKQDLNKQPISNVMTLFPNCSTCDCSSTISQIIQTMIKDKVTSVVICDSEKPVDIITVKDILILFVKKASWL